MFQTKTISPLDLHLDERNPRFRINVNPSQEDIRKYMIRHEKLLDLANAMVKMDTLLPGERVIIYYDGTKNIVLEGNRRTCAYQMFLDRSLIPIDSRPYFPYASKKFLSEISNIPVDVVENRQEAMAYLAARHIIGVEKWSSVAKWKISYEYFSDGYSINQIASKLIMTPNMIRTGIKKYKILLRGVNNPIWTNEEKEQLNPLNIRPDKLLRILGLQDTIELFGLSYSDNLDLISTKYSNEVITKLIVLLTKMAFITNEINTRSSIWDVYNKLLSEIPELNAQPSDNNRQPNSGSPLECKDKNNSENNSLADSGQSNIETPASSGGKRNIPYFFEGLQFGNLDPSDPNTHGVSRICLEIKTFSTRRMVEEFPISAAFLTRSLIEQSLIYYAKNHKVQALPYNIWERISKSRQDPKLSDIIESYKRSLADYIPEAKIRDYFTTLFGEYNKTANPLNWVIHRPYEFVWSPKSLIELPSKRVTLHNKLFTFVT